MGSYTVTVTDSVDSIATATIIITQPALLATTATVSNVTCGNNNGSATINGVGGTLGHTYSWNPTGQTTQTATDLGAGTSIFSILFSLTL